MEITQIPQVHQLSPSALFEKLTAQEQLYAHHLSWSYTFPTWAGARIVMRQTSPEANDIFDLIISLYSACNGDWKALQEQSAITEDEMSAWLDYAATFLSNVGNYYGSGDQKIVPRLSIDALSKLAGQFSESSQLFARIGLAIYEAPPHSLGYPGKQAQSAYYIGHAAITKDEITKVTQLMESKGIHPENTRLRKIIVNSKNEFQILQASAGIGLQPQLLGSLTDGSKLFLVKGDHRNELVNICSSMSKARKYASNEAQKTLLNQYIESFQTGDLEIYRESQRTWIRDKLPQIENIFGFVEPYRDPHGVRAEFEGLVAIKDSEQTQLLQKLVDNSETFIATLPWVVQSKDKFAFENKQFDPPDLTSIHTIAYCSSILFPGINLPNYNDIRQDCGFKNVITANIMAVESTNVADAAFLEPEEIEAFQKSKFIVYYIWVVLHELLGHGTGKMLRETSEKSYNFDRNNPPIDPLTGRQVEKWYSLGQTWTGQFGDLATTVDECRAELVGAFLLNNAELLKLFGHDEETVDDLVYNLYLQLATDGLRGLANYNVADSKWGQAHSRAHFAILICLLRDGDGVVSINFEKSSLNLVVRVARQKITSGHEALGKMLLTLHMYRVTGDIGACHTYYEDLTHLSNEHLGWRDAVLSKKTPKIVFSQPNTQPINGRVLLKEYPATREGVIQSWAERDLGGSSSGL